MSCASAQPERGFTLLELVVVVVVIGVLAAVAVPRFASATGNAQLRRLHADTATLQQAIDLYTVEHDGLTPAHEGVDKLTTDESVFRGRLLDRTDAAGEVTETGLFGPYLRSWPLNPMTQCQALRIDGAEAGQDCGWHFDSTRSLIRSDHGKTKFEDLHKGH